MTKIFTLWNIQFLYLILANPSWLCQGAHILAVMPSVWKSHYLFGHYILTQLVEQHNHTVTLISPYEMDNLTRGNMTKEKCREIKVEGLLNNWLEMGLSFDLQEMHDKSVM